MTIKSVYNNDKNRIRRTLNRNVNPVVLGDVDGNVSYSDAPASGLVYVRRQQANGEWGPPFLVRGSALPGTNTPGIPVELAVDKQRQQRVEGADFVGMQAVGINPTQYATTDPNANNSQFVNQQYLTTAYAQVVEGTLKVGIRGWIRRVAGVFYKVEGQVDFTGSVPSSGNHGLAVIAAKPDLTLEVQYSTAKNKLIPLDLSDVNEAWALMSDPVANVALSAFSLADAQTTLSDGDRFLDLRELINTPDSAGYEVIQDMIATFLAAGANITLTYSDVGNSLTIAVSGLTASTISDFSEAVDDRVAALLAAGTNISLTYNDAGNVLTVDLTGVIAEANGGTGRTSGAATKALDNLASVAINTSLISDTDNTDDLGSSAKRWANTYSLNVLGDIKATRIRNGSGATANAGDVGYCDYDATYGLVYKTTTTANFVGDWCAVVVGAADGSDIYIAKSGPMILNYSGTAPAAGEFLTLGTTAGKVVTNALMRYEVVAIATAAGSGGTVAAKLIMSTSDFKPVTNSNNIWSCGPQSDTLWTGTINGAPSATSVVVTTSTGSLNCFTPLAAGLLANPRLHNTTRGTYRLVTAISGSTITTVSTSDAWATTDALTIESRTVTNGLAFKMMDLDMKVAIDAGTLPRLMRSLFMEFVVKDTSTTVAANVQLHPFDTYAGSKTMGQSTIPTGTPFIYTTTILAIVNGTFDFAVDATGSATASPILRLLGYFLATE